MARDHKVAFLSEETLAQFARWLRRQARPTGRFTIDIIDLIERVLTQHFAKKGGLKIDFYDAETYDEPAFVTYRPLTLHVDKSVWKDAKRGVARAYYILAHEIAHLLFHDHTAVAYSGDATRLLKAFPKQFSAEWQADTFARHLTMPDEALRQHMNAEVLSIVCNVENVDAQERLRQFAISGPMAHSAYTGDACGNCGSFTVGYDGNCRKCETCGLTAEMFMSNHL